MNSCDQGEEDEPEPDEDIDFLVDDVEREDTETILGLHTATRSILVESTFGHLKQFIFAQNDVIYKFIPSERPHS